MSRIALLLLQAGVAIVSVALWCALTTYPVFGTILLPPFFFSNPLDVASQVVDWFVSGVIWKHLCKDIKILSDTRTQKDTRAVFGGDYPGGALYTKADWIDKHPKEKQGLTTGIVNTLAWIHSHSPEEVMAKMPQNLVGPDKAGYLSALKNTIPMYSTTGKMDPKGAEAVLAVFSLSSPEVAKANIDVTKTYTNKYVDAAKTTGMK